MISALKVAFTGRKCHLYELEGHLGGDQGDSALTLTLALRHSHHLTIPETLRNVALKNRD